MIDVDYKLVGIVALADLRQSGHIDMAVREISQPDDGSARRASTTGAGTGVGDARTGTR